MDKKDNIEKEFSAIILSAGKSLRMRFPKLSLKYDEKYIFIEHIIKEYEDFGCGEIVVVVNETGNNYLINNNIQFSDKVKIIINNHPEWHRFYSLKLGVKALLQVSPVFIHNVDNPFVNHTILNGLCLNYHKADYINPTVKERGGHPILISEQIVNDIISEKEDQIHMKEFLNKYKKLQVQVKDENILVNINTLEEYKKYFNF